LFPSKFEYVRARSTDEALEALARYGADARILAGGQSLIPAMRYRLVRPAVLVDINPIEELAYIHQNNGSVAVGACTRDRAIETSDEIRSRHDVLADAAAVVADPVVRQTGTLVGSLCHNDPAGDWPVAALATRAEIVAQSASGSRTLTIDDFLVDSYTTALREDEIAVEVRFSVELGRTAGAYYKIERKVGDFATAAAGVRLTLDANGAIAYAGVAIGAVGPKAMRVSAAESLLLGAHPSDGLINEAVEEAKRAADPSPDNRGSAEYKREMAGVLVGRALRKTLTRLGVGGAR
jgi:carbon-monoxide dehydrogenase medium subunit